MINLDKLNFSDSPALKEVTEIHSPLPLKKRGLNNGCPNFACNWYCWSVVFLHKNIFKKGSFLSLYTRTSTNSFFLYFECLNLNLIVVCFLLSSLINFCSSSSEPVHLTSLSTMNLKSGVTVSLVYGNLNLDSKLAINKLA